MVTLNDIRNRYTLAGFAFFSQGDLNLNIFGIRTLPGKADAFDDVLGVAWRERGLWCFNVWPATTDPGLSYLRETMGNPHGTAVLCPGQYRGSHVVGLHRGQYEALVQDRAVKVWRDRDKDGVPDRAGTVEEGVFGINLHHAGDNSPRVAGWSAGCNVFQRLADFEAFMVLVRRARALWGSRFTYTLFEG